MSGFTLFYHIINNLACIVNELLSFSSITIDFILSRDCGGNSQFPLRT